MLRRDPAAQARLQALQDDVCGLELQLARKRSEMISLTNSLAPVSSLPPEVLAEIFIAGRHITSPFLPFPLLVSHVHRHWREVALQSPGLWTNIYIGDHSKSMALLDLYLKRSRTQPLDVEMTHTRASGFCENETSDIYISLFNMLARHAVRWRSFNFHVDLYSDSNNYQSWFSSFRNLSAPRLESLRLEYDGYADSPVKLEIFSAGAPLLSSVVLCGDALPFGFPSPSSVSSLELGPHEEDYWYSELHEVLVATRTLSKLVLHHHLRLQPLTSSQCPLPFEFPSLRSLEILPPKITKDPFRFEDTFNAIEAPNLDSLILDIAKDDKLSDLITAFGDRDLSTRFPRLSTLGLHLRNVPDDRLPELCDALPTVTRIISTHDNVRGLLNFLDATKSQPRWLDLVSVTILNRSYKFNFDLLCAVISSRLTAGHPIRRLEVPSSIAYEIPMDRLRWLREHVELRYCM